MKIVRFEEAETAEPQEGWKRLGLCREPDISIEHFTKPAGHASPMHHHANLQVLVLLKGKLVLKSASGAEETLHEGDCAYIPGNEPHCAVNPLREPAVGLDIYVPGRSLDFWEKRGVKPD